MDEDLEKLLFGTIHHMALQIAALPIDEREAAFELARESFEESLIESGQDPWSLSAENMIVSLCESIRATVADVVSVQTQ